VPTTPTPNGVVVDPDTPMPNPVVAVLMPSTEAAEPSLWPQTPVPVPACPSRASPVSLVAITPVSEVGKA